MEKFTDLMVKDTVTGESLRADKLLEDIIDGLLEKNPAMPTVSRRSAGFLTRAVFFFCRLFWPIYNKKNEIRTYILDFLRLTLTPQSRPSLGNFSEVGRCEELMWTVNLFFFGTAPKRKY